MLTRDLPYFKNETITYFSYIFLKELTCKPQKVTKVIDELRNSNEIISLVDIKIIVNAICELIQKNLAVVNNLDYFIKFYNLNTQCINQGCLWMDLTSPKILINLSIKGAWVSSYEKLLDN